jgi:acylphosphatase
VTIRRRAVVHGQVQGVFYRDSCRTEARRLGVAGFVRNLDDGTVEAVFEGDPDAVGAMLDWAYTGPQRARVSRVEVSDEEPEGLTDFQVR